MRRFLTSLMAFFLSLTAGTLVAQQLAVQTNAGQEYILVFMSVFVIVALFTAVFFAAQFFQPAAQAVDSAAKWSFGIVAILSLALFGFEYWMVGADLSKVHADLPILAGLILPAIVIVLVQWLFVRWRVGRVLEGARTA